MPGRIRQLYGNMSNCKGAQLISYPEDDIEKYVYYTIILTVCGDCYRDGW